MQCAPTDPRGNEFQHQKTSTLDIDDLYQPNSKATPCKRGTIKEDTYMHHLPMTSQKYSFLTRVILPTQNHLTKIILDKLIYAFNAIFNT